MEDQLNTNVPQCSQISSGTISKHYSIRMLYKGHIMIVLCIRLPCLKVQEQQLLHIRHTRLLHSHPPYIITHHEHSSCFMQFFSRMTAQVLPFPWPCDLEWTWRAFESYQYKINSAWASTNQVVATHWIPSAWTTKFEKRHRSFWFLIQLWPLLSVKVIQTDTKMYSLITPSLKEIGR